MKLSAFAAASLLFLVAVFKQSSCIIPSNCVLNRKECPPPANSMPADNEFGIYSTSIKIVNLASDEGVFCVAGEDHSQIRPLQMVGDDRRVLKLYSPGSEREPPVKYGNQLVVIYNTNCPENTVALFKVSKINMEEPSSDCGDSNDMKCVDYLRVVHGDNKQFMLEDCGSMTKEISREVLTYRNLQIIFRTSDTGQFPGFKGSVICVDAVNNVNNRRKRSTSAAADFEAALQRQTDHINKIIRYYQYLGYYRRYLLWYPWLFRLETVIIQSVQSFTYRNNRLTTLQGSDSQSFKDITILKVLSAVEEISVFRRSATDKFWNPISFPGPGTLIIVGCSAFYRNFVVSQRGILPLTDEERFVVETLLDSHFDTTVLEAPEQQLCDEILNPPPFNFSITNIPDSSNQDIPDSDDCAPPNVTVPNTCNFTDDDLRLALANENSSSIVVRTVVDVVLNCTRTLQPGRIRNLTMTEPFDASCSIVGGGRTYSVSCSSNRRRGVSFTSCRVNDRSSRSVPLDSFCEYPSFTFPVLETMIRPGEQTLILDLEDSEGSTTTEMVNFFAPLVVDCSATFGRGRPAFVSVTCSSNQNSLTVTECVMDGTVPLSQCAFPSFTIRTAGLASGQHNVMVTFRDETVGIVTTQIISFTLAGPGPI